MTLTRRTFIESLAGGAFITVAPGVRAAFADTADAPPRDTLVVLFLRFGMDGLTLVAPVGDSDYHALRPHIAVTSEGLPAGKLSGVPFFFHPLAPGIANLYASKKLAVVHAVGIPTASRSHFESQDLMERAVADGDPTLDNGWLARHMGALGSQGEFAAISNGPSTAESLLGDLNAFALTDVSAFDFYNGATSVYAAMHGDDSVFVNAAARRTLADVAMVKAKAAALPPPTDAGYTRGALSSSLQSVAQIIKMNLGAQVITADFGGWDHHVDLPGVYPAQAYELAQSLQALADDLGPLMQNVTLVTMTEFGRRAAENASFGLDHGAASVMLVMGGNVNGGKIYGSYPGLNASALDDGDYRITTDYRQVLAEVLSRRQGQAALSQIFPTVRYAPLGVVRGTDAAQAG